MRLWSISWPYGNVKPDFPFCLHADARELETTSECAGVGHGVLWVIPACLVDRMLKINEDDRAASPTQLPHMLKNGGAFGLWTS